MKRFLESQLQSIWFQPPRSWVDRLFLGLAKPFAALAQSQAVRTQAQRRNQAAPVPVIVVGNIVVGGSGKTPITAAIAQALSRNGLRVGVIASGYGSPAYQLIDQAKIVGPKSRASALGDEAILLAKLTGLPVAVSGQRQIALEALLKEEPGLQAIVSDDGLQHAALTRSIELCVIDARGFGNALMLPAGPLREPIASLAKVDALILNGMEDTPELAHAIALAAEPGEPALAEILAKPKFSVYFSELRFLPFSQWINREQSKENFRAIRGSELAGIVAGRAIAAIAGTASPANFFNAIKRTGLQVACYPLADHAPLTQETLSRMPESFVVMTEKDAVKWPKEREKVAWVAVRDTQLDPKFITWLLGQINPKKG